MIEITIDGINIKYLKIREERGLLGMVTQEPILFNDFVFNSRYRIQNSGSKSFK